MSTLQSWKSAGSSSASAEHKATPKRSWLSSSADADFALWRTLEGCECEWSFGWFGLSLGSLFNDLDLRNSLGGEREERVGEKGISFWGGCCRVWREISWGCFVGIFQMGVVEVPVVVMETVLGAAVVWPWWWLMSFLFCRDIGQGAEFLPLDSPLSLRLFRFVEVFVSSGCSPSVFILFAFFLDFLAGDGVEIEIVKMLLVQLVLVLSLLLFFYCFCCCCFCCCLCCCFCCFVARSFSLLSDQLSPPFFRFTWVVYRFQGRNGNCAGGRFRVDVVVAIDSWLLWAGTW